MDNITMATPDTAEGLALLKGLHQQYGTAAVEAELERSHGRIFLLNGAVPASLAGRAHPMAAVWPEQTRTEKPQVREGTRG